MLSFVVVEIMFRVCFSSQEFCLFAVLALGSDFFLQMCFFTTVLSVDIRRMEASLSLLNDACNKCVTLPSFALVVPT